MRLMKIIGLASLLAIANSCAGQTKIEPLNYPKTRVENKTTNYHGTKVTDPYAWLGNLEAEEVNDWVVLQDSLTSDFVKALPEYAALQAKVSQLGQVTGRTELPFQSAAAYYYLKQESGQQWGLYQKKGADLNKIELPFNPRRAFFSIPSPNDAYLALGIIGRGQVIDWKVLDMSSGKVSDENLIGTSMSKTRLTWRQDGSGFYYLSSDEVSAEGQRSKLTVKFHGIGQAYAADQIVYTPENDGAKLEFSMTDDDKHLVIEERQGSSPSAKVSLYSISAKRLTPLLAEAKASYLFLGNDGEQLFFETDDEAPNGKIVSIHSKRLSQGFKTVVAETEESITGYQSAGGSILPLMAGGKLVVPTQKDLVLKVSVYETNGTKTQEVTLPSGGLYFNTNGLNAFSGNRKSTKVHTRFIGLTEPNTIFEIDLIKGDISAIERAQVNFNSSDYTSEIVFSKSKDGTKIPISLTYKKGTKLDGKAPLMMQVYGAIAFTNYPYFQGDYISWLEMGGIHGVAHIRGGGAYGAEWHQQGIGRNKQKGIDDYIAALEWVVKNDYTSKDKLVINAVSAGTIPVGGVLAQRPDLIAAVVSHYGMFDMVGYESNFSTDANHNYMIPDLGKASDPDDFKVLNSYSPYQNIAKNKKYPPVLALTSDMDSPLNVDSYKLIARLQATRKSKTSPMLLQMAWGSGHSSFGSQTYAPSKTFSYEMAFLIRVLGLDVSNWLIN